MEDHVDEEEELEWISSAGFVSFPNRAPHLVGVLITSSFMGTQSIDSLGSELFTKVSHPSQAEARVPRQPGSFNQNMTS